MGLGAEASDRETCGWSFRSALAAEFSFLERNQSARES